MDIFFSVAKRRDVKCCNVKPVIEVLPEAFMHDLFLKISVGGGQCSEINWDFLGSANSVELLFLQDPQHLSLHDKRHFSNFIKKNNPTVHCFE